MPDLAPTSELLRSLGRLVRGLSALFWGLPVALVICVQTLKADGLHSLGFVPPIAVSGWLLFALWQLGDFQKQERVWMATLDRAKLLGLVNLGLAPFVFFWNRLPHETYFNQMLLLLMITGLLFISSLNVVLLRLTAMLPDETLRAETKHFTSLNRGLLFAALALVLAYLAIANLPHPSEKLVVAVMEVDHLSLWLTIGLVLLPLAITMSLLWKIKEAVMTAVFGTKT